MAPRGIHGTRPANAWQDAYLTGNGRHGAMVFGDPYDETVIVTHHALVVPNESVGSRAPELADRLEEVRDLILDGRSSEALARFTDGRELQWVQPFHPAFALRLRLRPPVGHMSEYRRSVDFSTGVITVQWSDVAGAWERTCFVSRADDVIVQRLVPPAGVAPDLSVDYEVRLPGAPEDLLGESHVGETVRGVDVIYPNGDGTGYCGVTHVVTRPGEILLLTRVAPYRRPVNRASVYAELVTSVPYEPDYDELLARHAADHRPAYERVGLDLGADTDERTRPATELLERARDGATPSAWPALLEKLFDAGRYHLLSASGVRPPRLVGIWQGDWHAAWSGAFTTNANLNLQLAGAVSGDLPEAVHGLARLIADQIEDWRANAWRIFGARGVLAPTHTDGESGALCHFAPDYPHHMWTAGADWLLVTLLDHARVSADDVFLRRRVLPLLKDVAAFYESFLTRRDDDGHVVFVPSYSPENAPLGGTPAAVNATMDIAAARHALTAAIDAFAGFDDAAVERWRVLLAALPPYRINDDGALAEWAWPGLADDYDHRHISHLYPVWPLHEITPHREPELADAALRALRLRGHENDSAHGYLHQGLVAARLRDADLVGEVLRRVVDDEFCYESLMTSHYPRGDVFNADASCALPGLLVEALVDSEPGRLELLPAVPEDLMPAGYLRGVRTLTRITVDELRWDLREGVVEVVLVSDITQRVTVAHADATWRGEVLAGVPTMFMVERRGEAIRRVIDQDLAGESGQLVGDIRDVPM